MEGWQAAILVQAMAVQADIEAMKAENDRCSFENVDQTYNERDFYDKSIELTQIAHDMRG